MMENKINKNLTKQFPLQDVEYEALDKEKKSVIKKLLYLYVFYASKGSKHSYAELNEHNYIDLFSHVWSAAGKPLIRNKGTYKQLQIMYYTKGYKNKFLFRNFLETLPTISCHFEPQLSQQEALKSLIYHCNTVYETKVIPQIDNRLINTRQTIHEDTRAFFSKLSPDLIKLYRVYFPHQTTLKCKGKHFKSLSFDCFMELFKQFQVFPKLISARDIFYIFNEACDYPGSQLLFDNQDSQAIISEMGEILRLSNFLETLLVISKRVFPKLKNIQNEQDWAQQQKLMLRTLLQYMETVKMNNKRKTKFMHERMCFIVLDEHVQEEGIKTIQVKDKIIKQSMSNMSFYNLMEKIKF